MTKMNNERQPYKQQLPNRKVLVDTIANFHHEPGYYYETVIYDYNRASLHGLVEYYEKAGYEICYSENKEFSDDRVFKTDVNKEDTRVQVPVYRRTSDGYTEVLMRIPEEKLKQHHITKTLKEKEDFLRAVGSKAKSMNPNADKLKQTYYVEGTDSTIDKQ